jgi:hypothetical protein
MVSTHSRTDADPGKPGDHPGPGALIAFSIGSA